MPIAEIITIGTELLLGENVDTNTRFIAKLLREEGIDLYRTSTIGDNKERIAQIIREGMTRSDILILTGGLGPTVDDPTRDAVALSFGVKSVFRQDLWEQIEERFRLRGRVPTENNKRMAFAPEGAISVENRVGTAPAFIMETDTHAVIALPGVPREMENLMQTKILPYLRRKYKLKYIIKTRILHTAGIGESNIDQVIGDLEELGNPTVGLAAHAGQVDIRITAKAENKSVAINMIDEIDLEIHNRLGECIYGKDQDTLEEIALANIQNKGWSLSILESGLGGILIQIIANVKGPFIDGKVLSIMPNKSEMVEFIKNLACDKENIIGLGVFLRSGDEKQTLSLVLATPKETLVSNHVYGGPPKMAPRWAVNTALDRLRKV